MRGSKDQFRGPLLFHLIREYTREHGLELPAICEEFGPFDRVFIDRHHERQATIDYFNANAPFSTAGAVYVFDDIEWSNGTEEAWRTIYSDRNDTKPSRSFDLLLGKAETPVLQGFHAFTTLHRVGLEPTTN